MFNVILTSIVHATVFKEETTLQFYEQVVSWILNVTIDFLFNENSHL
jgi:hypothetical protein